MFDAPSASRARSQVAILTRYKGADAPEVIDARRDLATAKIEEYIEQTVAKAPPLTDEQKFRIVATLGGAR